MTLQYHPYTIHPTGNCKSDSKKRANHRKTEYEYAVCLGDGKSEKRPTYSLLEYAQRFARDSSIKDKTKDSYRLMSKHLEKYGDCTIDNITTNYLQGFIAYLQEQGLKIGSVRLYFQKLACVLHYAYKNGLFDDRILQRVKRPKREQEKKSFLTESELKKLTSRTATCVVPVPPPSASSPPAVVPPRPWVW